MITNRELLNELLAMREIGIPGTEPSTMQIWTISAAMKESPLRNSQVCFVNSITSKDG